MTTLDRRERTEWTRQLRDRGYCIQPDAVPKHEICKVHNSFESDVLSDENSLSRSVTRTKNWHVVRHMRQSFRMDWEVLDATPVLEILDNVLETCGETLQGTLGVPNMVLNTCGVVASFPGCGAQVIHRDGPPAMAPYALTVFVPLVDVSMAMGPTEYYACTHTDSSTSQFEMVRRSGLFRPTTFLLACLASLWTALVSLVTAPLSSMDQWFSRFVRPAQGEQWLPRLDGFEMRYWLAALPFELLALGATCDRGCEPTQRGAVLLHDYRVYHRGMHNCSRQVRPVLYFTFSQEGYDDSGNYTGQVGCVERGQLERASERTRCVLRHWDVREPGPLAGKAGLFFGFCNYH